MIPRRVGLFKGHWPLKNQDCFSSVKKLATIVHTYILQIINKEKVCSSSKTKVLLPAPNLFHRKGKKFKKSFVFCKKFVHHISNVLFCKKKQTLLKQKKHYDCSFPIKKWCCKYITFFSHNGSGSQEGIIEKSGGWNSDLY